MRPTKPILIASKRAWPRFRRLQSILARSQLSPTCWSSPSRGGLYHGSQDWNVNRFTSLTCSVLPAKHQETPSTTMEVDVHSNNWHPHFVRAWMLLLSKKKKLLQIQAMNCLMSFGRWTHREQSWTSLMILWQSNKSATFSETVKKSSKTIRDKRLRALWQGLSDLLADSIKTRPNR